MNLRWWFLWPLVITSLILVGLCAFTAISLFQQHAAIVEVMRETVESRRAATELEECLLDINVLLRNRVESVEALHGRAHEHLNQIDRYSDQPEEKALSKQLRQSFGDYLKHWKAMPLPAESGHAKAVNEAASMLETNLLKTCEELISFNAGRIETAVADHEHALRQLAWGIAGISGLGGVAGLVLGFGLARGLSQSIRRLQVQIRDAAGRLGDGLPEIVLTGEGDLAAVHEQMDRLSERIEAIVQRLHDREREVLRAEQMAAVGQLATSVAHEIRNPLTSIKMLVQASLEEDGTALASEDLRVIEQEIRRMERSLKTFLDLARPPKVERRRIDLLPLVHTAIGLTRGRAEKQGVHVVVDAPAGQVFLMADGEKIHQVLVNLLLNALDAMPTGGILTLAIDRTPAGDVEIRVSDTGPGIAADLLPRLFQPFVSGKETGLGMGLVICRRIVENHGGAIRAANNAERGAVFTVSLPAEGREIRRS